MALTTYETVFITEPEISNDQVEQLVGKIKQTITAKQGTITNEDRWGRRRLAYAIAGHREGYYVVLAYTAESAAVSAVEHIFNVTDSVIRHLTIKVVKKNKTFPPRREKPAGAAEGASRGSSRSGGPSRARSEGAPKASPAAPAEAAKPAQAPGEPTA